MNHIQDISAVTVEHSPRLCHLRRLFRGFWHGLERARTRRLLAQLDERDLADLGTSHTDLQNELEKPFWRQHSAHCANFAHRPNIRAERGECRATGV
ncbi:DUF1127 domain-containing protein [Pseudomonas sp. SDO52101_S400]